MESLLKQATMAYAKSNFNTKQIDEEKVAKKQIKAIESVVLKNAESHISETRIKSKGLAEGIGEHFRKEGFIVWENNEILVIKIA